MVAGVIYEIRQLTICDLLVAVTDAALAATGDEDKAYEIANRVLVRMLQSCAPGTIESLLADYRDSSLHAAVILRPVTTFDRLAECA